MQNKTIKLGESDIELLQRKASEECCSASEVMRRALREYCGGDTAGDAPSWVVDLLRQEIAELRRQLDQSQQLQLHQLAAFQRALPEGKAGKAKKAKKKKSKR